MKIITFIITLALANIAYASDPHHYEHSVTTYSNVESNGTALAIAIGSQQFNWSTKAPQASVGVGSYNGSDALSVGVGKRFGRALINGSVGTESGKTGFGAGISWRF